MKRNGSIMIFVLLTFVFITTLGLFALYIAGEQIQIANNSIIKIQRQYLAESKINKIFYDENYYKEQIIPSIMSNTIIGQTFEYKLDKSDMFLEDHGNVYGRFYNHEGKRYIELATTSTYNGAESVLKAYGPVFNQIFYDSNPALSYSTIDPEYSEKFHLFMENLSEIKIEDYDNIRIMEFNDYEYIKIKRRNSTYYDIYGKEENGDEERIEEGINHYLSNSESIFMIVRNDSSNVATLKFEGEVYPRGLIYVEGTLVVSGNLSLNGILIVNGEDSRIIIDENINKDPIIYGALVYDGDLNRKEWNLIYDIHYINRFGVYIPNFIEPSLSVYKLEWY